MTDDIEVEIPEGYVPIPGGLGWADNLQPSYMHTDEDGVSIGMVVQKRHANTMGLCHGGALMTLMDMAVASALNHARGIIRGAPTVNMSVDFVNSAKVGEWIYSEAQSVSLKRRFGFSNGVILGDRGIVARYNGICYFPDHEGLYTEHATRVTALGSIQPDD